MDKKEIIEKTKEFVKEKLSSDFSGHDWWHSYRVWRNAVFVAKEESKMQKVDLFIVELAALLHDVDDWKLHNGDLNVGANTAKTFLSKFDVDEKVLNEIEQIILTMEFMGKNQEIKPDSFEGKIVQDADRLDAMGAIEFARGFMFAGNKHLKMYDPDIKPNPNLTKEEFKNYMRPNNTQINHFQEKAMYLKNLMNTTTARKIAEKRHKFMEQFLDEFFIEWDGLDLA